MPPTAADLAVGGSRVLIDLPVRRSSRNRRAVTLITKISQHPTPFKYAADLAVDVVGADEQLGGAVGSAA
ncbi:hypothetical protein ACFCYL_39110, partial [Streptomyces sp. NPDC056305]|uniref:hypothetical protein n=1 Tax=Streptomyces sp. NPDC056305 TaxID=3345779 RepID=UPI0035D8FC99